MTYDDDAKAFLTAAVAGTAVFGAPFEATPGVGGGGATFILTTALDAPGAGAPSEDTLGTALNDIYRATSATLSTGDVIDGGDGIDRLILTANVESQETITSTNLEIFEIKAVMSNNQNQNFVTVAQINLANAVGLTEIVSNGAAFPNLAIFANIRNNVTISLIDVDNIGTVVQFGANAVGTGATVKINMTNTSTQLPITTVGADSITKLDITATGTNVLIVDNFTGPGLAPETITARGTGTLIVADTKPLGFEDFNSGPNNEFRNLTTVDASANSGGVLVDLSNNAKNVTFTGGAGVDGAIFGKGGFNASDKFDGGGGFDFLGTAFDDADQLNAASHKAEILLLTGESTANLSVNTSDFGLSAVIVAGDLNNTLTLDKFDGNALALLTGEGLLALADPAGGVSTIGGSIAFSNTNSTSIIVGVPPIFQPIGDLIELLTDAPVPALRIALEDLRLNGVASTSIVVARASDNFTVEGLGLDAGSTRLTVAGAGDFQITALVGGSVTTGLATIDLTGLTGGFNSAVQLEGQQTIRFGAIGGIASADAETGRIVDVVAGNGTANENQSYVELGEQAAMRDIVEFTSTFAGTVVLDHFDTSGAATGDVIKLSSLGIGFIDINTEQRAAGVLITSDAFAGSIFLVGVAEANVTQNIFAF